MRAVRPLVRHVELRPDGPALPVDVTASDHGPTHPQRLVGQAVREAFDRR